MANVLGSCYIHNRSIPFHRESWNILSGKLKKLKDGLVTKELVLSSYDDCVQFLDNHIEDCDLITKDKKAEELVCQSDMKFRHAFTEYLKLKEPTLNNEETMKIKKDVFHFIYPLCLWKKKNCLTSKRVLTKGKEAELRAASGSTMNKAEGDTFTKKNNVWDQNNPSKANEPCAASNRLIKSSVTNCLRTYQDPSTGKAVAEIIPEINNFRKTNHKLLTCETVTDILTKATSNNKGNQKPSSVKMVAAAVPEVTSYQNTNDKTSIGKIVTNNLPKGISCEKVESKSSTCKNVATILPKVGSSQKTNQELSSSKTAATVSIDASIYREASQKLAIDRIVANVPPGVTNCSRDIRQPSINELNPNIISNGSTLSNTDVKNAGYHDERINSTKNPKIPSMTLTNYGNREEISKKLVKICRANFTTQFIEGTDISLQLTAIEDYHAVIKFFNESNIRYNIHPLVSAGNFKVILRDYYLSASSDEIKNALESLGYQVIQVSQMKYQEDKSYRLIPLWLVVLPKTDKSEKILSLKELCGFKIKVETYREKINVKRCYRCQRWGHESGSCYNDPRCVRCTFHHGSSNCPTLKGSNTLRCVNCLRPHTASYKGCSKYKSIIAQLKNKTENKEIGENTSETQVETQNILTATVNSMMAITAEVSREFAVADTNERKICTFLSSVEKILRLTLNKHY